MEFMNGTKNFREWMVRFTISTTWLPLPITYNTIKLCIQMTIIHVFYNYSTESEKINLRVSNRTGAAAAVSVDLEAAEAWATCADGRVGGFDNLADLLASTAVFTAGRTIVATCRHHWRRWWRWRGASPLALCLVYTHTNPLTMKMPL